MGGEEFCVFLSHAAEEQALEAAWRLLRAIRSRPVRTPAGELTVTASAGVAGWRRRESVEALIDRADQALYEAKRSGRDRARAHGRMVVPLGAPLIANA
jgi:diguanylate cyclase (GGDEF)-like protein